MAEKGSEVVIAWDPVDESSDSITLYEVRYFKRGNERNASSVITEKEETRILNLKEKSEYVFQVSQVDLSPQILSSELLLTGVAVVCIL